MALLGDDRDLAHLGQERLAELVDLRGRRLPAGEDAEVDPDLEPGRLGLSHGEGDLRLAASLQIVLPASAAT